MQKRLSMLTVVVKTCLLGTLVGVCGWTAPTTPPPSSDPGLPSGATASVATGCACNSATVKSSTADWPQGATEQAALWTWWVNGTTGWIKYGNATNTYNCFSYAFNGSDRWLDDPSPFFGTTAGCWTDDTNGSVRKNSAHACEAGYKGKAGRMFLQNKNDDIYGAISNRYKKL